jgi:hypothetical protein
MIDCKPCSTHVDRCAKLFYQRGWGFIMLWTLLGALQLFGMGAEPWKIQELIQDIVAGLSWAKTLQITGSSSLVRPYPFSWEAISLWF